MSFDVAAEAYGRFMGVYSEPLAVLFAGELRLARGQRALDVGCGPGALTEHLVQVLGREQVHAVDPSEPFVAAARRRLPGVDVRRARAEDLPFDDDAVDVSAAQLVVHFMTDPVAGLAEMVRVTRPGGVIGATVWDHAGNRGPLSPFWQAAHAADIHGGASAETPTSAPTIGESTLPGVREGHLIELMLAAGATDVEGDEVTVEVRYPAFDDWWEPYTLGVGPAGAYVARLSDSQRNKLRDRCHADLGDGPFTVTATAWTAVGRVAEP